MHVHPDLGSGGDVVVIVKDVNDNPPEFNLTNQVFGILRSAPALTLVTTLKVRHPVAIHPLGTTLSLSLHFRKKNPEAPGSEDTRFHHCSENQNVLGSNLVSRSSLYVTPVHRMVVEGLYQLLKFPPFSIISLSSKSPLGGSN